MVVVYQTFTNFMYIMNFDIIFYDLVNFFLCFTQSKIVMSYFQKVQYIRCKQPLLLKRLSQVNFVEK